MFTARKIASYVFFLAALLAIVFGCISATKAGNVAEGGDINLKKVHAEVEYRVVETTDAYTLADNETAKYAEVTFADGKKWTIIAKTADSEIISSSKAYKLDKAADEKYISCLEDVIAKGNATDDKAVIDPIKTALKTAKATLIATEEGYKDGRSAVANARNDAFWTAPAGTFLPVNGYLFTALFCATVATVLFLKKEEEEVSKKAAK